MRIRLVALGLFAVGVIAAPLLLVHADSGFDSALFSDTNGDRGSVCAQPAFNWSGSMAGIAQQRAQDIANSGDFTNRIEAGVGAENIGWSSGTTDQTAAAAQINQAYLNSPEHKANICDARWNVLGIGSVYRDSWNGHSQVWIDAEEFARASSGGGGTAPNSAASPPRGGAQAPGAPGIPSVPGTGGAW